MPSSFWIPACFDPDGVNDGDKNDVCFFAVILELARESRETSGTAFVPLDSRPPSYTPDGCDNWGDENDDAEVGENDGVRLPLSGEGKAHKRLDSPGPRMLGLPLCTQASFQGAARQRQMIDRLGLQMPPRGR